MMLHCNLILQAFRGGFHRNRLPAAPRLIFMGFALSFRTVVLFTVLTMVAGAQYIPQIPIPHRRKPGQSKSSQGPTIQTQGLVRSNDGKTLVVASEDGRTFTIALSSNTTYTRATKTIAPTAILSGSTVQVESSADDQDNLTAIHVDLLKDPVPEAAAKPDPAKGQDKQDNQESDEPRATILRSPVDAPNRPILRHGASPQRSSGSDSDDVPAASSRSTSSAQPAGSTQTASNHTTSNQAPGQPRVYKDDDITVEPDATSEPSTAAKPATQDLISRSRDWVGSFTTGLPNYVCQQSTTRYQEESRQAGWQALDIVTAQVVYEDGKESYRDITVGGRKTNKSMLEVGGSTSTGEFATTLRALFAPQTNAKFTRYQTAQLGQGDAVVYDFKVDLRHSEWQIRVGGQTLRPAYSGSVWIDKRTAEVRRIEMQADSIPTDFPLDTVEWAVDYDKVMLGASSFFLPVHADNLGCQRGSSICMKNSIDFRNYHKYAGESTITFDK